MTFQEAFAYRRDTANTINKDLKDPHGNDMEMIIVPMKQEDRSEYFNYHRGSFSDALAIKYSSDDQYGVIAISYITQGDPADVFFKILAL